jgi:heterodisulfide reductase subunit C
MAFNPDFEFRKMIVDVHLTDKIKYCYQCSRCTDVCPVSEASGGLYNPRMLIMGSLLGLKGLLMGADQFQVWGCQVCDTCDEECPQSIHLTEIFALLKNLSVQAGAAPDYYTSQAKMIFENGKAIPMQAGIERRRVKLELPKVQPPDLNEIQTILKATKLDTKIKYQPGAE